MIYTCDDCGANSDCSDGWVYDVEGGRLFCESCKDGLICSECGSVIDEPVKWFGDVVMCPDCRTVDAVFTEMDELPACGPNFQWSIAFELFRAQKQIAEMEKQIKALERMVK